MKVAAFKNTRKKQAASSSSAAMNSSPPSKNKNATTKNTTTKNATSTKNTNTKNTNTKNKRKASTRSNVLESSPKKKSKRTYNMGATSTSIREPREIDIVCGRGCGRFAKAPGNLGFRQLVGRSRWRYEAAQKHAKVKISREIVEAVKAQPGTPRFLMENLKTKVWEELSSKKSAEKTSQTFRDLRTKPMIPPTPEEEAAVAAAATLTNKELVTPDVDVAAAGGNDEQEEGQEEQEESPHYYQEEEKLASSTEDLNDQHQQQDEAMYAEDAEFLLKAFRMLPKNKKAAAPSSSPTTTTAGVVKDTDILYENHHGLPVATHPGSQAFFRILRFNQAKYHHSSSLCAAGSNKSQQNEELAQSIVTMIQHQGGRFLEKKTKTSTGGTLNKRTQQQNMSTWTDMSNADAVQKTCQAQYQLMMSNSDSTKPDSNDFLGLCSWLSGQSILELHAQESDDDSAPHRLDDDILMPRLTDVLIGRDHGSSSQHPGNLAFRWMAHYNRTRYTSCPSRREKVNLIETILAIMQHQGARLVEQNALTKAWCEISNIKAVTETSLALRRAASQSLQPCLEANYQQICQSIILGASSSSSSKVGNSDDVHHKSVVKENEEEKELIVYSNEVFDEPSFPDGNEVPVVYADEVFFHTPVLEPELTISVSSMLALEPAFSLGQPTSMLSTIYLSSDPDGSLSLGPPLVNTLSWCSTPAPATSPEPFLVGRQASSSHPAATTTPQRAESSKLVPPPLLSSLMSATTDSNWIDALYFLPDEKFNTKHDAPAALADHNQHSNSNTHNVLEAIPSPPAFVGTQSFIAVWDIEKGDQDYGNSAPLTLLEQERRTPHFATQGLNECSIFCDT